MAGPDARDLRAYYQRLTDEALADLHAAGAESYTPEAWALLDEEFRARNPALPPSMPADQAAAPAANSAPPPDLLEYPLDLVTVFASGDAVRILMVKVALESAGVPFLTKGEGIQDLIGAGRLFAGFNLATGPVQIQVRRVDLEDARAVLEDLASSGREGGASDEEGSGA